MRTRKLQELVDTIETNRAKLIAAVSGLSEDQLAYKPGEGQWSAGDILHHLALTAERSAKLALNMAEEAKSRNLPPDGSPEDSMLGCLDQFAELTKNRIEAPPRVSPRSYLPAAESLARLAAARERMMQAIDMLAPYDLALLKHPHPVLGEFNMYQWLLIAGRHEGRHRAQIKRLMEDPGFPRNGA